MSYTDVFTGDVVQPTDVSWAELDLTTDQTLVWPVPRILDVINAAGTTGITFPAANLASPGQDCLVNNLGANSVTVYKTDGVSVIVSVPAGNSVYVYLTDNTTVNGQWKYSALGVSSSTSTASALQGYGVSSLSGLSLNQDHQFTTVSATTLTPALSDRARFLNFTGASGSTWTLDDVVTAGFFFLVRNSGTANISLAPNHLKTIDGAASKTVTPGNACEVHFDGTNWFSMGYGQSTSFAYSSVSLPLAAFTGTQSASAVGWSNQNFVTFGGILTGNLTIEFPATSNLYAFYDNTTHGAYTLTVKAVGGATSYAMTQGERMVFYADGGELRNGISPSTQALLASLTAADVANSITDQSYALAMAVALG